MRKNCLKRIVVLSFSLTVLIGLAFVFFNREENESEGTEFGKALCDCHMIYEVSSDKGQEPFVCFIEAFLFYGGEWEDPSFVKDYQAALSSCGSSW